jgi:hypothetical protein
MSLIGARGGVLGAAAVAAVAAIVERAGAAVTHQNNSDTTIDVTIPADANAVVVYVSGYRGITDTASLLSTLSFSGSGMQFATIVRSGFYPEFTGTQIEAFLLTSANGGWPGSGARVLTFAANGSYAEGFSIAVQSYRGVDTGSPVVSTDRRSVGGAWTSALTGVGGDDLGILAVYRHNAAVPSLAVSGQTEVVNIPAYNNAALAVAEELGESAMVLPTTTNTVVVAFALAAAG